MNKSVSFEDLIVWKKAHQFVLKTYELTKSFPKSEIYGLTNQYRRASVSIPANIAEGYKKKSSKDKLRFLNIAQGSLEECRYYLILTKDLNYKDDISKEMDLLIEVSKLLNGYCKAILNSITS
ncbi:four helix bundle protein [Aquimarina megaterium]|uniref:four helix bundle protein n=1 Tax=Aquimarina megaterium TaxID=1443666 RepID=UPI0009420DF2|nr:four helix bundle protein [Aquimarina megaterium]